MVIFFLGILWVVTSIEAVQQAGLVPDHENLSHFGCVKASGFNDRKASCIELILRALRSLNRERFHVSPNAKDFRGRALATMVARLKPGLLIRGKKLKDLLK